MEDAMTRKLRALLVEDTRELAEIIRRSLGVEFRKQWNWTVEWTVCGTAAEAHELVQESSFDFALVDILLGPDQPSGFTVAEDLVRTSPGTFTLALTIDKDTYASYAAFADAAGVQLVLRAQLLNHGSEWVFPALAQKIRRHVLTTDPNSANRVTYPPGDLGVSSILEGLGGPADEIPRGETLLRKLTMACLEPFAPEDSSFHISYLAAGRSGAQVCRVDVLSEKQPKQSFVLKLGLDKRALLHEREANQDAARALSEQVLVRIIGDVQTDPASGYSAMVAKLADRADSLAAWLRGTTTEQARSVANLLFETDLHPLLDPALSEDISAGTWLGSSAIMRLRADALLARTRLVLEHPRCAALRGTELITSTISTFVHDRLPVESPNRLAPVLYARSFGDLHSTNILVRPGRNPRPILIDASRYGARHWSADAARLTVDLFLRVRRPGVDAVLWDDLAESTHTAAALCPRCDAGSLPTALPVDAFVHELITTLPTALRFEDLGLREDLWHWQWHAALAKEFLRQGCHQDLPTPRSTLAVIATADHLHRAVDLVNHLRF
jgi:hypothetical protein